MLSAGLSLIAGLIVALGYGLCGIRSPAPPAIALLGLLGMLAGERAAVLAVRHLGGEAAHVQAAVPSSEDRTLQTPPA
jgi:XapX domain-containing protein